MTERYSGRILNKARECLEQKTRDTTSVHLSKDNRYLLTRELQRHAEIENRSSPINSFGSRPNAFIVVTRS